VPVHSCQKKVLIYVTIRFIAPEGYIRQSNKFALLAKPIKMAYPKIPISQRLSDTQR